MKKMGCFIALEGTDGSGKTVQLDLLLRACKSSGHTVFVADFPRYGNPSAYFVEQYLRGEYGGWQDVDPKLASVFYALDRLEAASDIRAHVAAGHVVLANRYVGSNAGHQGAKIVNVRRRR